MGNEDKSRSELLAKIDELERQITAITPELKYIRENREMVREIHAFLHEGSGEDSVSQRSVIDDLRMLRVLYNRFSGFSTIIGFIIGVFTVGIPIILGLYKLFELLVEFFKTKGG